MLRLTEDEIDALSCSEEYAEYVMRHSNRLIGNGAMLLDAMEDSDMFEEFLSSYGYEVA